MNDPESLDEQALEDDWHTSCPRCPECGQHRHAGTCNDPPEYEHPEDTMEIFTLTELFEQYERLTNDRISEDKD